MDLEYDALASRIDHALLHPTLDLGAFEAGIELAKAYQVASVCIVPHYVRRARDGLAESGVKPSTTIGFPHGGHTTALKAREAEVAIADGAEELDMVINLNRVLGGDWDYVRTDIAAVLAVSRGSGKKLKVIFENCYLEASHKLRLCELSAELGADWVKTSTGFGSGGATLDDVRLMREHSPPEVGVKASGGIADLADVLRLEQYVTRLGTSRTAAILDAWRERLGLAPIARSLRLAPSAGY